MTPPPDTSTDTHASPAETLAALDSGAALRWWQTTSLVDIHGPDALSFLDGLCTQAVERIEPGSARLGLFLDAKAKIIAPAVLWRVADAPWTNPRTEQAEGDAPRVLLEVPTECVEALSAHLRKYRLRAKADVATADLALLTLAGPSALEAAAAIATATMSTTEDGATAIFVAPAESADTIDALARAGAVLADPGTWEAMRIERGDAGLHDLLTGRMPAEVGGMERAVALDAGCYLGQEPVVRLHYRGHANRSLRCLRSDDFEHPAPPADATPEALEAALELRPVGEPGARAAGRITTWARHPDGHMVALAVLRREVAAGTTLELPGDAGTLRVSNEAPEG